MSPALDELRRNEDGTAVTETPKQINSRHNDLIIHDMKRGLVLHDIKHIDNAGGNNGNVDDDEDEDDFFDDDDEDHYYDEDDNLIFSTGGGIGGNILSGGPSPSSFSSTGQKKMTHSVANSVSKMQELETKKRTLHTSRDDRATSEQCLDPRTRLILFKMLSNGTLDLIDGCLSTGKEANVYYAKAGRNKFPSTAASTTTTNSTDITSKRNVTEFAIKIYKTSILVFKDRDKYVSGEHRWRRGYCKYF